MTVTWHVDDLKISHQDEEELTKLISELGAIYGIKLTAMRGKVHSYLGMHFDFS